MRILRGKSNLEVSSQGFALFMVGVVLATFIGGGLRTILSSDRVHQRIVSELKSRFPRNEFQIGQTEVLLSRGLWPGLGLRLQDVVFKQDVCGKLSFELTVPQAILPVDLFSLRSGRARLGHVEINGAHLHLDYHPCPATKAMSGETSTSSSPRTGFSEVKLPQLDWKEFSKSLSALDLKDLTVTYEKSPTWKLIFKQAAVDLTDEMDLQARVDVEKSLPFGSLIHAVDLQAHGDHEALTWKVNSEFKEGRLAFNGHWDLTSHSALAKVQLTQLPLKDFTSELFQMGLIENDIKLKTAWLTCSASWEGAIDKASSIPVHLQACKLEGAYGRVDLEQGDFYGSEPNQPFREAAKFRVKKLQLQPLIESLGRQVLPAVIARLGEWTGALTYGGPKIWQLDGELENAEVIFSNQSVRGKQLISKIHTLAQRTENGIEASIDKVALPDGEFVGHLEARLGETWRSGSFMAQVERLALSENIQYLLIGGLSEPVKFSAQGHLNEGELSDLTAQFHVAGLKGTGWHGQDLNVNANFVPGKLKLDARAERAEADSRWRLYPQLKTTHGVTSEALAWRDLIMKLEVQKQGGTLSQFSAMEISSRQLWRAKGAWVRDGALTGTLMVGSGQHAQSYILHGEKGALSIQDKSAAAAE